ncbi:MAG: NUDIX domain-containing protein [Clostridia bacterium]|nr:NUDIX domain-containing protein [Clostridia bacterium]
MFIEEYNEDKITKESCELFTTRVKEFIINDKNEILIAESDGGCQLPGGHSEEGESLLETIIREVQEETGIRVFQNEISQHFYEIRYLDKNYHGTGKNRFSKVVYSIIKTNKKPNIENINLTENEKKNHFKLNQVNIKDFEKYVKSFIFETQKEINNVIAEEILRVFIEFKKIFK